MLQNPVRNIVLGISGGIAAYKSADLVRRLRQAGSEVRVVMTEAATAFVTPLTFQALSGHPVHTRLLDPAAEAAMGHIELARWADAILVAPASADLMARLAHGLADDLLTTLCLASDAPLLLAPAMNRLMWANPATRANAELLQQRGITLLGPAEGEQACGETGAGRMLEPQQLVDALQALGGEKPLAGRRVLVTAGPTREAIDPVRYISNRSSGRMGYAVAQAAKEAGAEVVLVSGPTSLTTPAGVERIDVESARAMHETVMQRVAGAGADVFIATAAVADYRPQQTATHKIKKGSDALRIELVRNADILADVAALPQRPFCVGFAAETRDMEGHARDKLARKRLDMIAANEVGKGLAFDQPDNRLHVFWPGGEAQLPRTDKLALARQLIQLIIQRLDARR